MKKANNYQDGGDGMIKWVEDFIYLPITPPGELVSVWTPVRDLPDTLNPETGRSYKSMWEAQKKVIRAALKMKDGRFIHRLIVLCWPRGEGKSIMIVLMVLWKFFNFQNQTIMLGANSKDQTKFVHYDWIRDIILNSPALLALIGRRNIQEKEIRIKDATKIRSSIRSVSSFTGIYSNITGYTFSEMFDMKNPKFFVQLDGSIRNVPNAIGFIDSTVSSKNHLLYDLYRNFIGKKTKTVFFHYRNSLRGDVEDYWNPYMTKDQLNDYKTKYPFGEFEKYFLNLWDTGVSHVFKDAEVEEMGYYGIDAGILNHFDIKEAVEEKQRQHLLLQKYREESTIRRDGEGTKLDGGEFYAQKKVIQINARLRKMDELYELRDHLNNPTYASLESLDRLGTTFDTDWAVLAGADFGDPFAVSGKARTIVTVILKGLVGSKSNPGLLLGHDLISYKFLYVLAFLKAVPSHNATEVQQLLEEIDSAYDGIDSFCSERHGSWDMKRWCEETEISFEPIFPSYERQKDAFKELNLCAKEGRFKAPIIYQPGSKKSDILREELGIFDHLKNPSSKTGWFGSVEKDEKHGIQDDCIFSLGWTLYGGRMIGPDRFRIRNAKMDFGTLFVNKGQRGRY